VEKLLSFTKLITATCCLEVFLRRCRSRVVPLNETRSKSCALWLGSVFDVPALFLVAGAVSAAPQGIKNSAPPFIRHDLTHSFCELHFYGHSTIIVTNSYRGVEMKDMTVVEKLGSFGLTITSAQVSALRLLKSRRDSNQSNTINNTINVLAANNVGPPGGSPCLVASNNIFDFIVTGDFVACTSNGPWGVTCEQDANTSVSLVGKIWT
jgi:hypothetical protein